MNNNLRKKAVALSVSLLVLVLILSVLMPTFSAIKGGNKDIGYGYGYVWDKSSIEVTGECDAPNAVFTITNTGDPMEGDMDAPSQYRVYRNGELVETHTFQLAGGESLGVVVNAGCDTIRLEADQRPGHPGNSHPQETIENCGC